MADFAKQNAVKPIDDLRDKIVDAFGEDVADAGAVDGTQYGVMFKGANKSTIWYNVADFEEAGVEAPETWDDFIQARDTLKAAGITPFSVGVDVGWPITDLFENVYIRSAGPEKYDQLAKHEIPWTDQSVKDALTIMQDIVGQSDNLAGGTDGALQTEMPDSVAKVFSDEPGGLDGGHRRLRPGRHRDDARAGDGLQRLHFPSIEDSDPSVVGGGDLFVKFEDSHAADAFLEYLTTTEAAEIWAERGGFSSPNKDLDVELYPDEITKTTASALAEAETFRFDLSDLQPAAFGGTPGQGLFKLFSDFVANPNDIDKITRQMEVAATRPTSRRMTVDAQRAEAPATGSPPEAGKGSLWERYGVAALFLAPALILLARVDRLSDDPHDHQELLRP